MIDQATDMAGVLLPCCKVRGTKLRQNSSTFAMQAAMNQN
jgi:hypothetical protein